MTGPIDWETLARQLGLITDRPDGRDEQSSAEFARVALERVIGDAEMRAAVDHYVSERPGSELARSVLWLLHPGSAMERCREISTESADREQRRSAVELLRVVADARVLPWISDYLDDEDDVVQMWGIDLLDQLLFSGLVEPEAAEELLRRADDHPNSTVREKAESIREFLRNRA